MTRQDSLFQTDHTGAAKPLSRTESDFLYAQLTDAPEVVAGRLARREHPDTSKEAAKEVAGKLGKKMQRALDALGELPGCTAAELDDVHVGNGTIRKRLNDLRIKGLARKGEKRKCRVTGRQAYCWYPTERE